MLGDHLLLVVRSVTVFFQRLGAERAAFLGSIVLSVVAISHSLVPNNDGMMYIETARLFQQEGVEAARQIFDWLFLPILIGQLSTLTGIELETSAYLLSILFVAGISSLLVACTRQLFPYAAWSAAAVVLAFPVLNDYRAFILREFGAWFLLILAFWLLLWWRRRNEWRWLLAAQVVICVAALFRLEVLVFLLVPVLWQLGMVRQAGSWARLLKVVLFPVLCLFVLVLFWLSSGQEMDGRLAQQLIPFSLDDKKVGFTQLAISVSAAMPNSLAAAQTSKLLLYGGLGLLVGKFFSNLGIFVAPLVWLLVRERFAVLWRAWWPFSWAFVVYFFVPLVFVLEYFFLSSRYVALLNLFVVPLVAAGLAQLLHCCGGLWRAVLVVLLVLAAVYGAVFSDSVVKGRLSKAAQWLTTSAAGVAPEKVHIEQRGIAYLVGWPSVTADRGLVERTDVLEALQNGTIELALIEGEIGDRDLLTWVQAHGLQVAATFKDSKRSIYALRLQAAQ